MHPPHLPLVDRGVPSRRERLRPWMRGFTAAMLLVLLAALAERAPADVESDQTPSSAAAKADAARSTLRREGDRYEGLGRFETTGDRITFYAADTGESFRVVENLALERVARVLEETAGFVADRQWQITAEVLEFRGANYLLLQYVVLKARSP